MLWCVAAFVLNPVSVTHPLYLSVLKRSLCYVSISIVSLSNAVCSFPAVSVVVLWHLTSCCCISKRCRSSKRAKMSQLQKRDSRCVGYPPRPRPQPNPTPSTKLTANKSTDPKEKKLQFSSTLSQMCLWGWNKFNLPPILFHEGNLKRKSLLHIITFMFYKS